MKKKIIILGSLIAMFFTACTREELPVQNEDPSQSEITVTAYTAGQPTPDTRVTSSYNEEDKIYQFAWETEEYFYVLRYKNYGVEVGSEKAKFTKNGEGNEFKAKALPTSFPGPYYAVYTTNDSEEVYDITNQSKKAACVMIAQSDEGTSYQFEHALAYLRLSITDKGNKGIRSITITTPYGKYAQGALNPTTGDLGYGHTGFDSKNIVIEGERANENTLLVAIPPLKISNETNSDAKYRTFEFSIIDDEGNTHNRTLIASAGKNIVAGKFYNASISLAPQETTCELPNGETFANLLNSILNYNSDINKIIFKAGENIIDDDSYRKFPDIDGVFYKVIFENMWNTRMEIYTESNEFLFNSNCSKMFGSGRILEKISSINFNNCINTSNVTSMEGMFNGCKYLTQLDLSNFNTSNVESMKHMFKGCEKLTQLDLSCFETPKVEYMNEMFYNCINLKELYITKFSADAGPDVTDIFEKAFANPGGSIYVNKEMKDYLTGKGIQSDNDFFYKYEVIAENQ